MQIILRQDVENLGSIGDIVKVKDGYARNFLIPQGFAYFATPGAIKALEVEKQIHLAKMAKIKENAEVLAVKLADLQLTIPMQTGEGGKVFGTVTPQMISQELTVHGYDIDRRKINIEQPIRSLGVFDVKLKLHADVSATIKIWVISTD
jgi:large subunit ribosomal protein L9